MSILNCEKVSDHISNWIKDYIIKNGLKTQILGLSGGIDSALVALLCKRNGLPLICINSPCDSSDSAYNRAKAFADDYGLTLNKIDLTQAHKDIYEQAKSQDLYKTDIMYSGQLLQHRAAVGNLKSCLRAPVLNFYSNTYKGLVIGTGNRSEDNAARYYSKFGDGSVDISPIADLFKSEVYQLFAYLAEDMYHTSHIDKASITSFDEIGLPKMPKSALDIYQAKPTADLWGPDAGQEDEKELGISYNEIEWADREDMKTGIIFNEMDPTKTENFFVYNSRQQEVLCKLHQMEKISRHKMNSNLPVCKVRNLTNWIK